MDSVKVLTNNRQFFASAKSYDIHEVIERECSHNVMPHKYRCDIECLADGCQADMREITRTTEHHFVRSAESGKEWQEFYSYLTLDEIKGSINKWAHFGKNREDIRVNWIVEA